MQEHVTELAMLEKALVAFREATGFNLRVERATPAGPRRGKADVVLRLAARGKAKRIAAEIKRTVNLNNLGVVAKQVACLPQPALLVTEYVNPSLAERLKQMNVLFLDTVGNAYLDVPGVFIYATGQRPPAKLLTERPVRAFRQAGLKVIFALFCRQGLPGAPYRTVAKTAGVALGAIGWIFDDLEKLGYLARLRGKGRKMAKREQLLERWVAAYPEQLRPKLVVGRYAAPDKNWWQTAHLEKYGAYWGGEIAAARLTSYLKPEDVTLYVRGLPGPMLAAHRLRKDDGGNVEVLKAFWDPGLDWADKEIAHPILVYADMLLTGDAQNLETARRLYDAQVARFVRED